ncbi:MAG: LuxR C-terminal-related transcriptional regulator [Actinomycetota bacterium]|nr:LuxR C-terminal-related transcriptional regulator [Actinomycetota bacterium]
MSTQVDPRVAERIERACTRALAGEEPFAALSHEVDKVVPFDGSMWFGVDPSTVLAVAPARFEALDEGYCQTFWDGEFNQPDVALYRDLARLPTPAAGLRQVTSDRPLLSSRYRRFVTPQGYDDELRVAFRSGDNTWAVAALYRRKGRRRFSDDEVALMAGLSGVVGAAFRTRVATGNVASPVCAAPGLLLFDGSNVLVSANVEADGWLEDIFGMPSDGMDGWREVLPGASSDLRSAIPILPLLARARAVAAGLDEGPARLRLRDRKGRWLTFHASCLRGGPADGAVTVVVEPAKSTDVAPIIIEAYGLSPRERDVVRAIARGLSTPDIAAELFLSGHTVRYYIKSVFEKVGVSTRGELVAKLFADHYSDPMHATAVHVH